MQLVLLDDIAREPLVLHAAGGRCLFAKSPGQVLAVALFFNPGLGTLISMVV